LSSNKADEHGEKSEWVKQNLYNIGALNGEVITLRQVLAL